MTKTVFSVLTTGLILSAISVFGDGAAELKKLVDDTRGYHDACTNRLGTAGKATDAFRSTLKNVEVAIGRNRGRVDLASHEKDHRALQTKLEELVAEHVTFHGPGKEIDSGPYQVIRREHPRVAAPKPLVEFLAKRILEKLLSPELFVDDKGTAQPFFLFQAVANQAPIKEELFHLGGGDHGHDLRRNLIWMLTEKGDEKGLAKELAKHDIAFLYFSSMQPFDLYVRTYFARRYDDVLAREKTYMTELVAQGQKIQETEKGIAKSLAGDGELLRRVGSGEGTRADLDAVKALNKQYQDFMVEVDKLPFRARVADRAKSP